MNKHSQLVWFLVAVLSLTLTSVISRQAYSQNQQQGGQDEPEAPAPADETAFSRFQEVLRQEILIAHGYLKLDSTILDKLDGELQRRKEDLNELEQAIDFSYSIKGFDPRLNETIRSCLAEAGVTKQQIESYEAEKKSRVAYYHDVGKACVLLFLENALCLTVEQIETLSRQLKDEELTEIASNPIYFGFFGFNLRNFSETIFEGQKGELLEPAQRNLLETLLTSSETMTNVDLGNELSTEATDAWEKEMGDWFLQLSTLKVQLFIHQYDLDQKAQQKLRIAAKGIQRQFINSKKALLGNVQTDFASRYIVALPPSTYLAFAPLWNRSVNSVISEEKRIQFQADQKLRAQRLRQVLADQCAISIIGVLPGINSDQMKTYSAKLVRVSKTVNGANGLIGYLKAYNTIPKAFYEDLLTEPQMAEFEQFLQMLDVMTGGQTVPPAGQVDDEVENCHA